MWKLTTPSCRMQPARWGCDTAAVPLQGFRMWQNPSHPTYPRISSSLPHQKDSYPKNGTSGDGKQEQLRWDPPSRGRRFHAVKLSGIFLEQISAYSSAHQAYLKRPWWLRTSSHSLALLVTPSMAIPAITVSPCTIPCCLHFSLTAQKDLCWLPQSFPADQAAGLCCTFILWSPHAVTASPREQLSPEGQGEWCSPLRGGPVLGMAAVGSALLRHRTFLLGCRAAFELPHNCTDLVHTCSLWVGGTSGTSSVQTLHSSVLKTTEVNRGLSTHFFKLGARPTFLYFKGHQNCTGYFQASVESPLCCCKARRVTCSASFFHQPSRQTSLTALTLCIFFSLTQRKIRHKLAMKSLRLEIWRKHSFLSPFPTLTFTQSLHWHRNVPLFGAQLPTSALPGTAGDISKQEPQLIKAQPLSQSAPQEAKCWTLPCFGLGYTHNSPFGLQKGSPAVPYSHSVALYSLSPEEIWPSK